MLIQKFSQQTGREAKGGGKLTPLPTTNGAMRSFVVGRGVSLPPPFPPHAPFTLSSLIIFLLTVLLTGCQFTQSPFVITVGNAGAEFAAASTTLSYVHTGKLSQQYAQASIMNYQSQLSGLDQRLPSQQGAPDRRAIERLLEVYRPAMQAVNHPCLAEGCDWQAQVAALDRASQAFLKAGGQ